MQHCSKPLGKKVVYEGKINKLGLTLFWFRRDLRLHDNAGLYRALKSGHEVQCVFIFDRNILDELPTKDARVAFIHDTILQLDKELQEQGACLDVRYGYPEEVWRDLLDQYKPSAVYYNRDFESYANKRDEAVAALCKRHSTSFHGYKDHVIFDKAEVVKADGSPYTVFTPYSRKWREKLHSKGEGSQSYYLKAYPNEKYFDKLHKSKPKTLPSLSDMGFKETKTNYPSDSVPSGLIKDYANTRNFPSLKGTSRLGIHYRFGTISIREKCKKAMDLSDTYVNELIWRDFYAMILYHFPHVEEGSFREKYDHIVWRNNEEEFEKWKGGQTGFAIVDAGMRELNQTGYMHNRVRMIVASFLTKHLLIDWRWGAAYFAEKLLDFDLASNNGGWQWAAGSGTDAAPYFRIFNPISQQEKFDKNLTYIKKWVPEYGTDKYPDPIVDHKIARERCLATYKAALG